MRERAFFLMSVLVVRRPLHSKHEAFDLRPSRCTVKHEIGFSRTLNLVPWTVFVLNRPDQPGNDQSLNLGGPFADLE